MQLKGRRLTFDRDAEDLQNRALESLAAGRVVLGLPIPIYPRATIVLVSDASRRQTVLCRMRRGFKQRDHCAV
jgi:hypothetical protein